MNIQLNVSQKMGEEILSWAQEERLIWPRDTAYQDDLKKLIEQIKSEVTAPAAPTYKSPHIGKTCLIRTYASGVHVGVLVNHQDRMVELVTARRLWAWHRMKGISLSDVATGGIDAKKPRVCAVVPQMTITDALEIIPMSDAAIKSVYEAPVDTGR